MRIASRRAGSSPIEARRLQVSRKLNPASTSSRVRSVATKVEFPELPLASAQILTIKPPDDSSNKNSPKQQVLIMFFWPSGPPSLILHCFRDWQRRRFRQQRAADQE